MPSKHQPSGGRHSRIESQMQRVLADLISREVKDPRVGNVTITSVVLPSDLSVARVHFLPFAGTHSAAEALEGLRSAAGFLRGELARDLKLRYAPRLEFELDTELLRAQQLTELIDSAVKADRSHPPDES